MERTLERNGPSRGVSQVPGRGVTRRLATFVGCSGCGEFAGLLSVVVFLLLFEDRFERVVAEVAAAGKGRRMTTLRIRGAAAGLAMVVLLTLTGPERSFARADARDWYTWHEAVALGLPLVKTWKRPPGMPICPPGTENTLPQTTTPPPDDAPECYLPPERQELRIYPGVGFNPLIPFTGH
jgi:hypothetical protein